MAMAGREKLLDLRFCFKLQGPSHEDKRALEMSPSKGCLRDVVIAILVELPEPMDST